MIKLKFRRPGHARNILSGERYTPWIYLLPLTTRLQLTQDMEVFGNAFVRQTAAGPIRVDPRTVSEVR